MTRWGSSGIPHAMSPFISPTVTTVEWGDAQTRPQSPTDTGVHQAGWEPLLWAVGNQGRPL